MNQSRVERFTEAALMGIMAHGGIVQRGPKAIGLMAVAAAKGTIAALDAEGPAPEEAMVHQLRSAEAHIRDLEAQRQRHRDDRAQLEAEASALRDLLAQQTARADRAEEAATKPEEPAAPEQKPLEADKTAGRAKPR